MKTSERFITAEDLLKMPDDGFRYELTAGILRKMSPAGHKHGKIAMKIGAALHLHVEAHHSGVVYAAQTGFKVASNPDTVRAPDAAFVSAERLNEIGDVEGFLPAAPDLAVEVVSPADTYTEVHEKVLDWLNAGTRVVVVADPRKRTLTVYRSLTDIKVLTEDQTLACDDLIPGWQLPVKGLFDRSSIER